MTSLMEGSSRVRILVVGSLLAGILGAALPSLGAADRKGTHARGDAASEKGPSALQVAASVQSFYRQTKGVRAKFKQAYHHKFYGKTDRSNGRVLFMKPGKMRWDYAAPNGKVIVLRWRNTEDLRARRQG